MICLSVTELISDLCVMDTRLLSDTQLTVLSGSCSSLSMDLKLFFTLMVSSFLVFLATLSCRGKDSLPDLRSEIHACSFS